MTINDRIERLEEYLSILINHIQYGNQDYATEIVSDMRRELEDLKQVIEDDVRRAENREADKADGRARGTVQR